ncbi:efflux transporter outer membrane subunit [Methylobacter sp.]|uniref:efflux transporter outer membrane subunit n=1 Tax=Methylobacter sp. TaxID=2051955 RepID=UPI00121D42F1|nr:efflux transporter outer membrane subunit [Methylobacter sp.]TAK64943.1 MAG: efflux transporter outer membrane subunit [Methylobacter sp.]
MTVRIRQPLIYALLTAQLAGCMVGPDYVRPEAKISNEFKESKGWKQAQPRDTMLSGKWWEIFNDPRLNELEEQVATANQSLIQAEAQYRQAQHLVQSAQSAYLPIINLTAAFNRFRAASGQSVAVSGVRNLFSSAVSMAWEPDLWGSVGRQVEANTGSAQASAATMQALRLSSEAALADDYFQLRALDAQKALLDETVAAYSRTLQIIKNRYAVGMVGKSDVMQAETQLESARAQAIDLGVQRSKLEHAIAVLIGRTPAELTLPAAPLDMQPPPIPLSLPSELLERRPDIAAAERNIAAANAQIGVAKAAYYPTLNLALTNGFQSPTIETLFTIARRYWALGPAGAALTLFDGGAKNAQYKQAIDSFDASVAAYRQTVLTGFQEVEDNLAALRILDEEKQVQDKAVAAANQALALITNQYQAGTVSYLEVIIAQAAALSNRQTAVQLQGQRLSSSVLLVKALGGGWNVAMLPSPEQAGGETKWTDYLILPVD